MKIRPDYKRLGVFKQNYQNVPIMALTATATQRVRQDVLHQLNIEKTKWYLFNYNFDDILYKYVSKIRMNLITIKPSIYFSYSYF